LYGKPTIEVGKGKLNNKGKNNSKTGMK